MDERVRTDEIQRQDKTNACEYGCVRVCVCIAGSKQSQTNENERTREEEPTGTEQE